MPDRMESEWPFDLCPFANLFHHVTELFNQLIKKALDIMWPTGYIKYMRYEIEKTDVFDKSHIGGDHEN